MSKNIKIRGIYSTALTELLRANKFNIIDASEAVEERFNFGEDSSEDGADNLIYDKEDFNGVTIHGDDTEKVVDIMKEKFKDSLFRNVENGSIYCGIITQVDQKNKEIFIDIGKKKNGLLSLKNFWGYLKEGEKVLVQIKGEDENNYLLSTQLRLFGKSLILIKDGFMKVSKHIRDRDKVNMLSELSKEVDTKQWGILWKSLAENKTSEELKEEINELLKQEDKIVKKFSSLEKPELISEGICIWFVDFGAESKKELDKLRSKVVPTVEGHHKFKSAKYGGMISFLDELKKEMPKAEKKFMELFENTLYKNSPKAGRLYKIFQKKVNGRTICAAGVIESFDPKKMELIMKRTVYKPYGNYDGLDVPMEDGDVIITKIKENDNYISHEYFSKDGIKKGAYISITTPIEFFPRFSRCIDLEIDVVEVGGEMKIIDKEYLQTAFENGAITKSAEAVAVKTAEMLKGDKK